MPCNDYGTAKFKYVEFEILSVKYSGGCRILTHKYPFSDQHYNEDLGDLPEKLSIKRCYHGKDFRNKFQIAKRIWGVKGDGVYFDPTTNRSYPCTLVNWNYDFDHKKLNLIKFTLEVVEKANDPYPSNILGLIGQINGIIDDVIGTISDVHVAVSQVVGSVRSVTDGLKAGYEYIDGSVRITMPSSGYVETKEAIADGVKVAELAITNTLKTKLAKDNVAAVYVLP